MIVDASSLLLILLPHPPHGLEPHRLRSALQRIARREPVESPALIAYELGHAIHRKRLVEVGSTTGDRKAALQDLLVITEQRPSGPEVLGLAGTAAEEARLSFYDAAYLAHSQITGTPLLTADSGLAAHARARKIKTYLLPQDLEALERDYQEAQANAP